MSILLSDKGLSTPPVVYVSIQDKLLIKKYVEGKDIHSVFENYLEDECLDSDRKRIACCVGSTFAETHAAGITIGDSKPENLVLSENDRLFFVDLEQAKKKGDQAWDIAEFLYFAGHHAMIMTGALKDFTQSFVDGYEEYGKRDSLRKAGGINYAKVFSFWTPPQIIYEISTILKST
jgi:tRNA A-37 threonylcarbamoyl transferase component Bud32